MVFDSDWAGCSICFGRGRRLVGSSAICHPIAGSGDPKGIRGGNSGGGYVYGGRAGLTALLAFAAWPWPQTSAAWPWPQALTPAAAVRTVFDRIPILSPRLSPHHLTPTSHANLARQIGL